MDQENSVSGAIWRDTLCLIFKHLEKQKLGVEINIVSKQQMIQRVSIAFFNDTDFYANSEEYNSKMQNIMLQYISLYKVTSRKIQE